MSKYKRKQSNILSSLKRRNIELIRELSKYHNENKQILSTEEKEALKKFVKRIYKCANISLYKQSKESSIIDFLAVHTCKSKTCFVCNFLRQKSIRRKYATWFKDNQFVYELKNRKNQNSKFTTEKQYLEKYCNSHDMIRKHEYDLMHLTLTVPHSEDGFKGEQLYFETLKRLFCTMRNESMFWNYWVLGGEYGMEATGGTWLKKEVAIKKEIPYMAEKTTSQGKELVRRMYSDGLHIHMHCLLLVRKAERNRNKLHREILLAWNKLTVDPNNTREEFSESIRAAIKKGNRRLSDEDINKLNPKGATFISLETIFTVDKDTGSKVRGGSDFNSDAMKKAVMETISYHFEPLAFEKEDKTIDLELLVELLPKLHGTRLYSKFGCLQGESSLNVKESGITLNDDFKEVLELLVNEDTGEITEADNEYFLCNPALVYHKKDDLDEKDTNVILSNRALKQRMMLPVKTTTEAISLMSEIVAANLKKKKVEGS